MRGLIGTLALLTIGTASAAPVVTPAGSVCNNPPTSRYLIKGAEVYDTQTKLTWQRCSVGQSWQESVGCVGEIELMSWTKAIQQDAAPWRLPAKGELATLISPTCKSPAINEKAFPNMEADKLWYWTSDAADGYLFWDIYFADGKTGRDFYYTATPVVRLVRG